MKALTSPLVVILLAVILSSAPVLFILNKESVALLATVQKREVVHVEKERPEKPWDFWTPEMENLARELADQRKNLDRREYEILAREKRLADEVGELDLTRRQIEQLRVEITNRLVEVQAQEVRNLKALAATYSKLSPPAAVAIFNEMDDLMVSKLLSLMKPEITSAILEEMSRSTGPDNNNVKRAAELSQRLRLLLPAKT